MGSQLLYDLAAQFKDSGFDSASQSGPSQETEVTRAISTELIYYFKKLTRAKVINQVTKRVKEVPTVEVVSIPWPGG